MPHVVPFEILDLGRLQRLMPRAVQIDSLFPARPRKHKVGVDATDLFELPENLDCLFGQRDSTVRLVLGIEERDVTALQIHLIPSERQELAPPYAGTEAQIHGGRQHGISGLIHRLQ